MKFLGLIFIIAIIAMGYYVYNPMVVDSADSPDTESESSSTEGCKGPFGIDSQKILNDYIGPRYMIGIVGDIDLEKNNDGTWYINNCELYNTDSTLYFATPYPQQNELKEGDFIGFSGKLRSIQTSRGESFYYRSGKILDHISSQSVKCRIDDINGLSIPSQTMKMVELSPTPDERIFVDVTGVIMAVQAVKNEDPEPDNPSDYLIERVVMKCADGNLYIANFGMFYTIMRVMDTAFNINLPSQEALGEGDIVTVKQASPISKSNLTFMAYYKGD